MRDGLTGEAVDEVAAHGGVGAVGARAGQSVGAAPFVQVLGEGLRDGAVDGVSFIGVPDGGLGRVRTDWVKEARITNQVMVPTSVSVCSRMTRPSSAGAGTGVAEAMAARKALMARICLESILSVFSADAC